MYFVKNKISIVFKIVGFLILFHSTLFANSATGESVELAKVQLESKSIDKDPKQEVSTVSLDSFGSTGMVIMIILSSLLGAFFVKDEFNTMLE